MNLSVDELKYLASMAITHAAELRALQPSSNPLLTRKAADRSEALAVKLTDAAAKLPTSDWAFAPTFRGYALLGLGHYLIDHSGEGEQAELCISIATDADKEGREVGEVWENSPGKLIGPDTIAIRICFLNAAGLGVLEKQLRSLRAVHFPEKEAA